MGRDVSREDSGGARGGAGPGEVREGRSGAAGRHGAAAGATAEQGDPAAVLQQAPQGRRQVHHG